MIKNYLNEIESIETLAGFEFLDLFLLGETGTGKTYTAQLIHQLSPRASSPFVAVNCAELTPTLIEAELFGYEKGAFTGAVTSKIGKFEAAAGGTLFLDEIGELPDNIQVKLLKVAEEKCITRVGGVRARQIDVRIIYATNRNLDVLREDLRYRIARHAIHLKPLRERPGEIVSLARLFLTEFCRRLGQDILVCEETLKILEKANWHGNIRELRSFIEESCLNALLAKKLEKIQSPVIELTEDLIRSQLSNISVKSSVRPEFFDSGYLRTFTAGDNLDNYLRNIENYLLKNALENHNNNQTRAAKELGISRTGLIKKLKRIGH